MENNQSRTVTFIFFVWEEDMLMMSPSFSTVGSIVAPGILCIHLPFHFGSTGLTIGEQTPEAQGATSSNQLADFGISSLYFILFFKCADVKFSRKCLCGFDCSCFAFDVTSIKYQTSRLLTLHSSSSYSSS